ncbi:uncharacterized protein LOC131675276 [Phymastichus coffea]|uniref:uncharacterized protein LOC131675276 n=1 Tax=Phymastichus coffea TaxID=108790 RepID=UPI00273C2E71|nr:uncharacterized protein LOC131675276 [Phymastichus coffea]
MKGLVSLNQNRSRFLENPGWLDIEATKKITDNNGNFDVSIPLSMILGFTEDYHKIVVNVKNEIILTRSRDNLNAVMKDTEEMDSLKYCYDEGVELITDAYYYEYSEKDCRRIQYSIALLKGLWYMKDYQKTIGHGNGYIHDFKLDDIPSAIQSKLATEILTNIHYSINKVFFKYMAECVEATMTDNRDNQCQVVRYVSYHGRRIVEMDKLAKDLWCKSCKVPISLAHLVEEKKKGLASQLFIQCFSCKAIQCVETSSKSCKYYYDSNLKLAMGMLDSGEGESGVNTMLSALNVPPVNKNSLKRYERVVGPAIDKVANESCIKAIQEEKRLTLQHEENNNNESTVNNNNVTDLTRSFDAAWTKKGRQHNSLSDMAVELILKNDNLVNNKCRIKTVIGDDDSSAVAALRRLSPYAITKWSDYNHVKKTFNSKLYDIKLNPTLTEYFSKSFALAIKQNQGNADKVKKSLENIIPHGFGEHDNCGSFCNKKDESSTYTYFKNGEPLSNNALREKLEKIIQPFINSSSQIAPCASSQVNESFNNIVCSKHPKSRFYGGSESHCYRVALAVCQKNIGYEFPVEVNKILNLSPGKHISNYRKKKQLHESEIRSRNSTVPAKKRRLELKRERSAKNSVIENKEGLSYESGSGYLNTSDLIDETSIMRDDVDFKDCAIIIFDLETTGRHAAAEIVQIGAISGDAEFEVYMMPKGNMTFEASEVNGIKICDDKMYYFDQEVITSSQRDGFLSFLYFLKRQGKPCILLAHNGFRFDAQKLINCAKTSGLLTEMMMFVKGFCDSLPIFKLLLPARVKSKLSFKQEKLAKEYLYKKDIKISHNALNDVINVQQLVEKLLGKLRLPISKCIMSKIAKSGIDRNLLEKTYETNGYEGLSVLLGENVTKSKKIITSIAAALKK